VAKKKSLFKKRRKSQFPLVAEPEAPIDEVLLAEILKPKIEEPTKPVDLNLRNPSSIQILPKTSDSLF
jgi:hypothetical protein